MTVGVPGTGITAIFYFLLILLMPVHELYLTLRGRSSALRWRRVLQLNVLCWAIVAVLWAEGWLLGRFFLVAPAGGAETSLMSRNIFAAGALVTALVTLVAVIVFVHLLRLVYAPRATGVAVPSRSFVSDDLLVTETDLSTAALDDPELVKFS